MGILSVILIMVFGLIFLEPLAWALGSTETILPYAMEYMRIILIGAPFMIGSLVLNNQLRYQGNAMIGMVGILTGAVLNIGLDPLFIFVFGMGIGGSALATILSQFVSFVLLWIGTHKGGTIVIRPRNFRPCVKYYKNILNGKEGSLNPLDIARMIYLGYLCGQANNLAGAMPVEEFMEILPTDIQYLSELMNELISGGAKKKKNSATPSAGARKTSTKK